MIDRRHVDGGPLSRGRRRRRRPRVAVAAVQLGEVFAVVNRKVLQEITHRNFRYFLWKRIVQAMNLLKTTLMTEAGNEINVRQKHQGAGIWLLLLKKEF